MTVNYVERYKEPKACIWLWEQQFIYLQAVVHNNFNIRKSVFFFFAMHETIDDFNYGKIPVHVVCNDIHVIFTVLVQRHRQIRSKSN